MMHPYGDRTLDELLAAAAPVTDHDLDRPEVRAAARALIEELPVPTRHQSASPTTAGDRPPLDLDPARRAEPSTPGDVAAGLPAPGSDDGTSEDVVVALPASGGRPRRRGRAAVAAAVAALALALGSAAVVGGGDPADSGDPAESLDPADGPIATDAPARPADLSDAACGWSTEWLDAEARGDQEAQDRVVARMAEEAAAAQAAGDEQKALEAEALMRPMSAGDVAVVHARQTDSCTG